MAAGCGPLPPLSKRLSGVFAAVVLLTIWHIHRYEETTEMSSYDPYQTKDIVGGRACVPKQSVVFLKTHKTGGTTLANILYRYGYNRNLKFALPRPDLLSFYWPDRFHPSSVDQISKVDKPNILASHARFDHERMSSFMSPDAMFITILRDPVSQFISMFNFMRLGEYLQLNSHPDPLEHFLNHAREITQTSGEILNQGVYLLQNSMSFDLGLDPKYYNDVDAIQEFIQRTEEKFDLVLLTERYEESLVILARKLCWNLEDVQTFKHNVQDYKIPRTYSAEIMRKIEEWNKADVMLYNHFKRIFFKLINSKVINDAKRLQEWSNVKRKECFSGPQVKSQLANTFQLDVKVQSEATCDQLKRSETEWVKRLLLRQRFL